MASNEVASVIRRSLTVDELDAVVEKVIDALPDNLGHEWLARLEDTVDFPPIPRRTKRRSATRFGRQCVSWSRRW